MILSQAAKYLKYIIISRHRAGHGIHSPFVFSLINRLFRNKTDYTIVSTVEKVRKRLRSDHRYISVTDLGSGSGKQRNNRRKVSVIARNSAVPQKYGALLSGLASEFGKKFIVEFGTSFGISTMYMALSCKDARVITMEGCPETANIAYQNFAEHALQNISVLTGPFDENLQHISATGLEPGLVFIDGNHNKPALIRYFNFITGISDNNTVVVIDDINYSKEMQDAWTEIKENEKVSLTIDIYRFGIVFFKSGVSRYDYVIRY